MLIFDGDASVALDPAPEIFGLVFDMSLNDRAVLRFYSDGICITQIKPGSGSAKLVLAMKDMILRGVFWGGFLAIIFHKRFCLSSFCPFGIFLLHYSFVLHSVSFRDLGPPLLYLIACIIHSPCLRHLSNFFNRHI